MGAYQRNFPAGELFFLLLDLGFVILASKKPTDLRDVRHAPYANVLGMPLLADLGALPTLELTCLQVQLSFGQLKAVTSRSVNGLQIWYDKSKT